MGITPRDLAFGFKLAEPAEIDRPSRAGTLGDLMETIGKAEYTAAANDMSKEDADMIATDFSTLIVSVEKTWDIPIARAQGDPNLSQEGRGTAYAAAAKETLEQLEKIEGTAEDWNEHVTGHVKALEKSGILTRPESTSEESWDATQRDVSWDLRTITDPLKRQVVYANALRGNNLAVIHALEACVPVINQETMNMENLIDPAAVRKNRMERARVNFPKLAQDHDRAERLFGVYHHIAGQVRRHVGELVPATLADAKPIDVPAVNL